MNASRGDIDGSGVDKERDSSYQTSLSSPVPGLGTGPRLIA